MRNLVRTDNTEMRVINCERARK